MSNRPSGQLAGSVRWAVVPFVPRPPFRLYAGTDHSPIELPDANSVIEAARRGGDAEHVYLVPAKARPILLLSDPPPGYHNEVGALRLLRLSSLDPDAQQVVREHAEPMLFHLPPERFDLPEENAAIVSALVRVHVEAIASSPPLGVLDDHEMRAVGERIIEFYGFDTRLLIERKIRELVARRSEERSQ